ncbi:hypothetical protein XENORESO_008539 [Xenotaenia resolanae]|uniref:Uncharacterized protein n=1 Tax=Xenotaenia resolanae TaxID=208358 RepID=A0ABV0X7L0_9TELE
MVVVLLEGECHPSFNSFSASKWFSSSFALNLAPFIFLNIFDQVPCHCCRKSITTKTDGDVQCIMSHSVLNVGQKAQFWCDLTRAHFSRTLTVYFFSPRFHEGQVHGVPSS